MKTPKKVEWEFVIWLKDFCELEFIGINYRWKVMTETHIYELMSTKKAYKFWYNKVRDSHR
jgi:hypothetical protein